MPERSCGSCGQELEEGMDKCPKCGVTFDTFTMYLSLSRWDRAVMFAYSVRNIVMNLIFKRRLSVYWEGCNGND